MMNPFEDKILELIQLMRPCLAPKHGQEFLEKELQRFVDFAVEAGIMPQASQNGKSALEMVQSYGSRWFLYSGPFYCQNCNEDLRDYQNGPPFKREILQSYSNYDEKKVHELICPVCKKNVFRMSFRVSESVR